MKISECMVAWHSDTHGAWKPNYLIENESCNTCIIRTNVIEKGTLKWNIMQFQQLEHVVAHIQNRRENGVQK